MRQVTSSAQVTRTDSQPTNESARGAVYTKPWVVGLVLDTAQYTADRDLGSMVAVEPACGDGEFLVEMVKRLAESARNNDRGFQSLDRALMAFEIDAYAAQVSRQRITAALRDFDCPLATAESLAEGWVKVGDFLLSGTLPQADFVVGNPPYVRIEDLDPSTLAAYRARFETMKGRSDLYIGFFERALEILNPDGVLVYICADRWMLNQYGGSLRRLVTSKFAVDAVIEMHEADAFHDEVLAYPAITRFRRGEQSSTVVARLERGLAPAEARCLRDFMAGTTKSKPTGFEAMRTEEWFSGSDPWPCTSPERLALLKRLEQEFPTIESSATNTRVGIGIATGSDKVFITTNPDLVEQSRLLPLAWHKDTLDGEFNWSGRYLVNPWEEDGSLVELSDYPLLQSYFQGQEDVLRARKIASTRPQQWYRTIDNLRPEVRNQAKLLIPDIKGHLHPVLERGATYPHHNLYYVVSDGWELRSLGGLLLSDVAQFFIDCYSVKMAGGYLRFQAQYLRRIRLPRPEDLDRATLDGLAEAFDSRDTELASALAHSIYRTDAIPG